MVRNRRNKRRTRRFRRRRGPVRNIFYDYIQVDLAAGSTAQYSSANLPFQQGTRPYKLLRVDGYVSCVNSTVAYLALYDPDTSTVVPNVTSGPISVGTIPQKISIKQWSSTDYVPIGAGTGLNLLDIVHPVLNQNTSHLVGSLKMTFSVGAEQTVSTATASGVERDQFLFV